MLFDSAFAASSASESLFFAVWIAIGATALVVGAILVIRANRVFRRRQAEVSALGMITTADRSERGLVSAA